MQSYVQNVYHSSDPLHKNPHYHDCHQIILVVKGKIDLCVNDRAFTAKAGSAMIFSRYENHSVFGGTSEYERYVLHIDPDIVKQKSSIYSLLTDRPAGFCNVIDVSASMRALTELFEHIIFEHNYASKLSDEMEQLLLKQLLITLYRCTPVNFEIAYDDVIMSIKRLFENGYREQLSLDKLSKQYSISVSSLTHRFKSATGMSVMDYLQSCRMANAKQMLAETDYMIGEIVEKCGFSDNSNFSRTFKALTGMSPSDFRKKYKAY